VLGELDSALRDESVTEGEAPTADLPVDDDLTGVDVVALKVDLVVSLRWLKRHGVRLNMLEGSLGLYAGWYVLCESIWSNCVVPVVPAV